MTRRCGVEKADADAFVVSGHEQLRDLWLGEARQLPLAPA
jgi:hypothetical protein